MKDKPQTMLLTPRLELLPATPQTLRWELHDHALLGRALNANIPPSWPPENLRDALEFFAQRMEAQTGPPGWGVYYWIARNEVTAVNARTLVGSGGFKGAPDANGSVEIGYGTLPEFWNKGYATEATQALVEFASAQPNVTLVWAEALPENPASVRVLEKCGFVPIGAGGNELGTIRFEHHTS